MAQQAPAALGPVTVQRIRMRSVPAGDERVQRRPPTRFMRRGRATQGLGGRRARAGRDVGKGRHVDVRTDAREDEGKSQPSGGMPVPGLFSLSAASVALLLLEVDRLNPRRLADWIEGEMSGDAGYRSRRKGRLRVGPVQCGARWCNQAGGQGASVKGGKVTIRARTEIKEEYGVECRDQRVESHQKLSRGRDVGRHLLAPMAAALPSTHRVSIVATHENSAWPASIYRIGESF